MLVSLTPLSFNLATAPATRESMTSLFHRACTIATRRVDPSYFVSDCARPLIVVLIVMNRRCGCAHFHVDMDGHLAGEHSSDLYIRLALIVAVTATYALIHAFLTKRSHTKVAVALRKTIKDELVLKDGIEIKGPQLDEIVKQWKEFTAKQEKEEDSER